MAGTKHPRSDDEMVDSEVFPFMPMFESFRTELDEHHDRRERIIKASRDITALSKKIIFSLQRFRQLQSPLPPNITKETSSRYQQITDLFNSIVPDLQGLNAYRYQRNLSGGIQEYIEALSFQHYLTTQCLISHPEAQATLPNGIYLSHHDYILGLFDLVGELMRFAITTMATIGEVPRGRAVPSDDIDNGDGKGRDILTDLRQIRTRLESLDTTAGGGGLKKDVEKKMDVMRTSVEKVERAVYGMIIRGRERSKGWVPDLGGRGDGEDRREAVESY